MARQLLWLVFALSAACSPVRAQFAVFGIQEQDVLSMYLYNGQNEATYRKQLEQRCQLRFDQIVEVAELDASKQEKLSLAMQGDINRFYRHVGLVRKKTVGLNIQDQNDMQKAWQEIQPLQERLSKGLLGDDSLFEKVLDSTLSSDQNEAYRTFLAQRSAARNEAIIKATIADLDRHVPMLAKQRDELLAAMTKLGTPKTLPQGYEAYLGYIYLTKLDSATIDQIFDKSQAAAIKKTQKQYEGYKRAVKW
ncbi:MAG: hypothetical protein R3C53_28285 [Pirellulaceae bacterium]